MSQTSSPPSLPLLLLFLLLARAACAAEDASSTASCSSSFRQGQVDFVLDVEDAVKEGAALLATTRVQEAADCERACCAEPRCDMALLEPRGSGAAAAESRTCVTFNCVHRNRFVCRFVNQPGYQSFIKQAVFQKHLQGPQGPGEQVQPIAIAGRDVIVQPGTTVMLNGIESLALGDAQIERYRWNQQSGQDGITIEKTDLPDQVRLSDLKPGTYVFQLTVIDSNDQSHATKVNVLVLGPEQTNMYCRAERKVGPCRAAFPRWYHDAVAGECKQFVFGGCKQNKNNFLSKEECESACSGVTASTERGIVKSFKEECGVECADDQLTCDSGCCVDRSVECDGVKHCSDGSDEMHCFKLNQTLNRLLNIDVNQKKARCSEPPLTGPCRASFSRWYYDPLNKKCYRFTYGGCKGNENNFEKEEKCSETCDGVTERSVFFRGLFGRYEQEEEEEAGNDSANIALAVLLSVAILALLAILSYCFLKKKKERSHRPVSTGPAHVALSEQDTLVYNSTTKPV
ncbi:kunitz-type protease inhibitor 1-like isoform X2 [Notolabrus celidotus]|uniref:kunitz-type protease inhibitor 1-like isoform X2 n=1 Tax=Notolabrus celidotus TaxID=1203425 RepID=UPI00148F7C92|nr:kunitz-type protease inhibitor 1-like isoform X2 [Notolabrus celidotus]